MRPLGLELTDGRPPSSTGPICTVGVISDTHGLLRPEAVEALHGSELILHTGDVGNPKILEALEGIAPVVAVRGNMDRAPWARDLPETEAVEVSGAHIYILHDLATLPLDPVAAGFAVVISGHTHEPSVGSEGGVLYLNPGSAGPRRFRLPGSVASLEIRQGAPHARIIKCPCRRSRSSERESHGRTLE